ALREPADAGPERAARESLRPVLAAAFAESGAASRRVAGAPGSAGARAPGSEAASCDGAPGSPQLASADPGSAGISAASEDKAPRSQAPRGSSRSRITSPGF
ncbi:MAG TPA: hypothetical protein VL242_16530, partial [Sorangium sp.]|nr:hypothetical protein [Sorangium sp.]